MGRVSKRKVVVVACVLALAAFAGGAYAAANDSSPAAGSQTFLNDVAKRLGVSPSRLKAAVQGALFDRLDAAVAAGRLTKAQADRIKRHVQQDPNFPLGFGMGFGPGFGPPRFFGPPGLFGPPGFFGPSARPGLHAGILSDAARYFGLSDAQLLAQLRSGKSLAQIASGRGKSTAGLKQALTSAFKARLDRAASAKRLSSAQEQQLLSRFSARLDQLINRQLPALPRMRPRSGGLGFATPGVAPGDAPVPPGAAGPSGPPAPGTPY